ncbi:hypothetical protein EXIGLDRAFT_713471 [Exidia glandulosa HHB12029]|uniref:CBF1-interacting co-repressor CIR N-terminal domain-containing protein n=1 Tax=Exidia glandulosa HHB12029 TaxID=1314781 RepID=A0A165CFE0_EXIGL|nr:hypothetical protein EXIGLDRAFT_713471 [Exidia glandulosa HHB12029]
MGRLVIAHHKSYHPYRRDNVERVRRDEEEARRKEEGEDARVMLADSEARISLLRNREGAKFARSTRPREDDDLQRAAEAGLAHPAPEPIATTPTGHINLFADLEQATASKATVKGAAKVENERGIPLAPSEKDLKPWYSSRDGDAEPSDSRGKETREERRQRDDSRKSQSDPLRSIPAQLSQSTSTHSRDRYHDNSRRGTAAAPSSSARGRPSDPVQERLSREASERARAAELIRRRRREMEGSMTPSTVAGGVDEGYSERYNRKDTEDAQRRRRDRRW